MFRKERWRPLEKGRAGKRKGEVETLASSQEAHHTVKTATNFRLGFDTLKGGKGGGKMRSHPPSTSLELLRVAA